MIKCDNCGRPAIMHITDIVGGEKITRHLCEQCASSSGVSIKTNVPISQLLEEFVLKGTSTGQKTDLACDVCGMTISQFRQGGLLGCPNDYDAFAEAIEPLLERAHEGRTQHIGKVPQRADPAQRKATAVLRLRAELRTAIAAEDYERAASIRDQIKELDEE